MDLIFRYTIVPIILTGFLALSGFLTFLSPGDGDHRLFKSAGCLFGLGVFALTVVLNIFSGFLVFKYAIDAFGVETWKIITVGFLAGFTILGIVHLFSGKRVISFFIAYLTSVSLISLYLYFNTRELTDVILVFSVSQLVGLLAYGFFRPKVVYVFSNISTTNVNQRKDEWICKKCKTTNSFDEEYCIKCDTWKYSKAG